MEVRPKIIGRRSVLSLLGAFAIAGIFGNTACEAPPAPPAPFYYYRVMWNGDAATSATVGWSSVDAPSADQKLYYDTIDHGTDTAKYAFSKGISTSNTAQNMNNVFVRLTGLQPDTKYYFVVADAKNVGTRYWFKTASDDDDERLSIIAGGDSRNNRTPRMAANSLVAKLRPDAVMFGGDMVDAGLEAEWKYWFQDWQLTIADDGRITPLIITRGNHERSNEIVEQLYDAPKGVYYAVNIGGDLLRIYTLNTEAAVTGAQTDWLKKDLAANQGAKWTFAQYHRPMRPHVGSKIDHDSAYSSWAGPFHQYGMDLVVECDAHTVKATWPIRPSKEAGSSDGFIRDDRTGTVYVGEGGWGAPLRDDDDKRAWTRDSGKFNHFQWMFVSPSEVEVRTVQVDNADEVEALDDNDDRFAIPAGIRLWTPPNGQVVKLTR